MINFSSHLLHWHEDVRKRFENLYQYLSDDVHACACIQRGENDDRGSRICDWSCSEGWRMRILDPALSPPLPHILSSPAMTSMIAASTSSLSPATSSILKSYQSWQRYFSPGGNVWLCFTVWWDLLWLSSSLQLMIIWWLININISAAINNNLVFYNRLSQLPKHVAEVKNKFINRKLKLIIATIYIVSTLCCR